MAPIRILHEVAKLDTGGIETLLMNIYRNIDREKIQFDFMTQRESEGFYDEEVRNLGGIVYKGKPFNPIKHNNYINSIDKLLSSHPEYKIIHCHTAFGMFPLRLAKKHNIPIRIAHSHNGTPVINLKYFFKQYAKLTLKNYCTDLFACSDVAGRWYYGNKAVNNEKVKIIKNGVYCEKFDYNIYVRNNLRKQLECENKFVIGHVGRFNVQKNHDFLIDIFKNFVGKQPESILLLFGQGELEEKIRNKVKSLNLENKVKFMGVHSDINNWMQAMDLFILPSHFEGLPLTGIEAQAAALPCIFSNNVTKEVKLIDKVRFIDLNENVDTWSNEMLDISNKYNRSSTKDIIVKSGYDISITSKWLQEFYIKKYNELS